MSGGGLPDKRRHAYREDLAAEALRGLVEAERYAKGEPRQVGVPVLPLRREPRFDATLDTEALLGEIVTVYDEGEGWAWVQSSRDGYVGYMPSEGLARKIVAPTHRVAVLRTYVYPEPNGTTPPLSLLSLNALVTLAGWSLIWLVLDTARLSGKIVIQDSTIQYLRPVTQDFVARCCQPETGDLARFLTMLRRKGRARLGLQAEIHEADACAVSFSGRYVVQLTQP